MARHGHGRRGPPERPPERGWRGVVFRIIDEKSILVSTKYVVRYFMLYAICFMLFAFDTMLFTYHRRKIDPREYKLDSKVHYMTLFALIQYSLLILTIYCVMIKTQLKIEA